MELKKNLKEQCGIRFNLEWVSYTQSGINEDELKPQWYYLIEEDRKKTPYSEQKETKRDVMSWIEELSDILSPNPEDYFLSGALCISILTKNFSRRNTNTDLAMLANKESLDKLISSAKRHDFLLFKRISGVLPRFSQKTISLPKYHAFYPITLEQAINREGFFTRNLELARLDKENNTLAPQFIPQNHIKLYLHYKRSGSLVCDEDKHEIIYPSDIFNGQPYTTPKGSSIYTINPEYLLLRLRKILENKESKNRKHTQDLESVIKLIKNKNRDLIASTLS